MSLIDDHLWSRVKERQRNSRSRRNGFARLSPHSVTFFTNSGQFVYVLPPPMPRLHPNLAELYRQKSVERFQPPRS